MKQLAIEAGKTRELETWRWFSAPTNISNFKTFQLNNIMRIEAGLKGKKLPQREHLPRQEEDNLRKCQVILFFTKWLADDYRCELQLLFPPTDPPDIRWSEIS